MAARDDTPSLVDLRSDTVTKPTAAMRRAMAAAEVGDDGYREDPTVSRLESLYADLTEMEAALFVPSGTMANQIALRVHCPPGSMVIVGQHHHVVANERGAAARNASVQFHLLDDRDGSLQPSLVAKAIEAAEHNQLVPSLVWLENTHMAAGGVPLPIGALAAMRQVIGPLALHLDGARLFNAAVAMGAPVAALASHATTVMTCLSKGLGAPVGSVLAGTADLIAQARLERRRLGGGMRQAGIVAAGGVVALTTMIDRLHDDHLRARRLAEAVADRWPMSLLDPASVLTNIVVFEHASPGILLEHLGNQGVLAGTIRPDLVRMVTHYDVDDSDIDRAVRAIASSPV